MKKIKLGILGVCPQNGHPYSFSAIINGYDRDRFKKTNWQVILNYLEARERNEIGLADAEVTHVWTQSLDLSKEISECCYIANVVEDYNEMIGQVDGVIIARDDYENHKIMAENFIKNGIPVFIDKPLTLSKSELEWYKPFYNDGLLMSCSGFRFCKELDSVRDALGSYGDIRLVRAAVINDWDKYGIHMLDATLGVWDQDAESVHCRSFENLDSYLIELKDGLIVQIDTLGPDVVTFNYEVFGTKQCETFQIRDNFSAFKRTIEQFINQVQTKKPAIPWDSLYRTISILIAGRDSKKLETKIQVKNNDFTR